MRYETRPLADLSSYISRGVTPAYTRQGGMLVLNQKCVRNNMLRTEDARRTDPMRRKVPPHKRLHLYDVLVNSTGVGTLGRCAQVKRLDEEMTADSHLTIVRPGEGVFPLFLGYALRWRQPQIEALAEGSTGQTELSRARLGSEIMIPVPPYKTQQAIGQMLDALDTKIEVNLQIRHNLLTQAQALFEEWFWPRDNRVPKGWRRQSIGTLPVVISDFVANGSFAALKSNVHYSDTEEYAVFVRNMDLKSFTFKKYVDRESYGFLGKTKLYGGEVLISNVGDVGSVYLCPRLGRPMTLGNNMIMLQTTGEVNLNYYLYLLFQSGVGQKLLASITGGSVQMKFNKTDFRALRILVPPKDVLRAFNELVEDMFDLQDATLMENQRLMEARDALLPQLMSGEIPIK